MPFAAAMPMKSIFSGNPMYFYVLHIEQVSETAAVLYGKALDDPPSTPVVDASACVPTSCRVRVENVHSPILLKAAEGKDGDLRKDIEVFMDANGCGYLLGTETKENVFYPNLERRVELIRMVPKKRVSFDGFFSDHCEAVITEFGGPVENIVISRGLRGPCVIRVPGSLLPTGREVVVQSPDEIDFVCHSKLPEMVFGSLAVRLNKTDILRYCLHVRGVHHRGVVKATGPLTGTEAKDTGCVVYPTSAALLNHLNALMAKEGIDCLVYHNIAGPVAKRLETSGMVRCDLFVFASGNIKGRDFSVEELVATLDLEWTGRAGSGGGDEMEELVWESEAILRVFESMDALHLSKEMCEISGYILNRTLQNLRAERIEYTLLHELYGRGYLFPPSMGRREARYSGGLVLAPQTGFYEDFVLLLDFNSLYPSIIQEFNVCFSTIGMSDRAVCGEIGEERLAELEERSRGSERGLLPRVLEGFVRRRRAVKELMRQSRTAEESKALDIRQRALKLTANSIYGCLGFAGSRFCNYTMAAYITKKGRELLLEARRVAEGEHGMKIIYGDTDSVMVHTGLRGTGPNYCKALERCNRLRDAINSRYRNIEIEVDKVFKKLLLYKKKRYAGLCMVDDGTSHIEYKGLDLVRKDFCEVSRRICLDVLRLLLMDLEDPSEYRKLYDGEPRDVVNNGNTKIIDAVYELLERAKSGLEALPHRDFVIHNALSKPPESYEASVGLPHVALALRLKERGMKFEQGDVVCYVIGKGDPQQAVHRRAYHPSESFAIDYEYYVSNQILPPLLRIVGLFKNLHAEKIGRIFEVSGVGGHIMQSSISFLMPCCGVAQEPMDRCRKCSLPVSRAFYAWKVSEMVRREVEALYSAESRCAECEISSYTHMKTCFNCNAELEFSPRNKEFDLLLDKLQSMFEGWSEVEEVVRRHTAASEYRRIDLAKYFGKEIGRSQ